MPKTNLFDLDGKIAFVSGASRGIGEAIAKLLAQQGAHVIVSSRKIEGCQAVADAIIAEGGKATAIACHIGEMEQIQSVFAQIREQFELYKANQEKSVDVEVVSAFDLDDSTANRLAQALGRKLERAVRVSTTTDSSLLGGVLIRAGDLVIDGSVRGRLNKLAAAMNS